MGFHRGSLLPPLTFRASAPVTATILRMPLAIASSETITKGPAWLEFCKCLWKEPRKTHKKRELQVHLSSQQGSAWKQENHPAREMQQSVGTGKKPNLAAKSK